MRDGVCPPLRMRYSFESRCRIVALILAGESPQVAAAACGASRATGYRLWARFLEAGWAGLYMTSQRGAGNRCRHRFFLFPFSEGTT